MYENGSYPPIYENNSARRIENKYNVHWPSQLKLQNTPTASLQRGKTPSTNVLDMTLSKMMVRLQ